MKRTAPKCRSCGSSRCSLYHKAGETERDSSNSKASRATLPSSSRPTWSKRQRPGLSVTNPSPVRPQQKTKKSRREVAPARKEVVIIIDESESDQDTTSHETDDTKTRPTSSAASKPTASNRRTPDLTEVESSPGGSQKKTQKSRNEVAREEVEDDVDDEESDEEKYSHNSRTCRALIRKLEGEGWYKRLDGRGHSLTALLVMEKAHLKSLNRPGRERFA